MNMGVPIENVRGFRAFANCPFHDDAENSLVMDLRERTFHCQGCGATGVITTALAMLERTDEGDPAGPDPSTIANKG